MPTLTSLSPNSVIENAGSTLVTFTGTGFASGCTLNVQGLGVIAATFVSATSVTHTFTPTELALIFSTLGGTAGTMLVTNPDSSASGTQNFTVTAPPADAWEDQIAEAVATELNNPVRLWASLFAFESCAALRTRKPWYEAADLQHLKVAVVPLTIERERASRAHRKFDYGIAIDLQKMVEPEDEEQLENLSAFAEQMHDFFDDGHALTGLTNTCCLKAERPDVYDLTRLYAERIWETLIVLSVRLYRP